MLEAKALETDQFWLGAGEEVRGRMSAPLDLQSQRGGGTFPEGNSRNQQQKGNGYQTDKSKASLQRLLR